MFQACLRCEFAETEVSRRQPLSVSVWTLKASHSSCLGILWYLSMLVIDCREWQNLACELANALVAKSVHFIGHSQLAYNVLVCCTNCNWSDGKLNWSKVIIINFIVIVYANFHSHYNFLIMVTWQFSHKNVHLCLYMCSQCLMWYLWSSCSVQSWKYYGCACKRTAWVRR